MIRFQTAVPTFPVADVGATIRWYRDHLGFVADHFPDREPFAWASLQCGGLEIMLMHVDGYKRPDIESVRREGYWDAYVRVQGVAKLYEAIKERVPIVHPLVKRFYGHLEFAIRDVNGYVLEFGERTSEGGPPLEEIA